MEKEIFYTYCVICCGEVPHFETAFDEVKCERCGEVACGGIVDRDIQIKDLAYENKMMSEKLLEIGLSQEDISSLCSGDKSIMPLFHIMTLYEDNQLYKKRQVFFDEIYQGWIKYDMFLERKIKEISLENCLLCYLSNDDGLHSTYESNDFQKLSTYCLKKYKQEFISPCAAKAS
jgi:hypothetical protein